MSDELKQVAQLEGDLEEACRDVDHKRVAQMNKVLLQMTITLIKERDEARAEATVKRLMLEQYKEEVAAHLSCGYCGWGPLWVNAHCSPTCAKASKEASKEDSGEQ